MRICPICKTELLDQDVEEIMDKKVHKGYCAQVIVELLTKDNENYHDKPITESVNNEISEYQLLS